MLLRLIEKIPTGMPVREFADALQSANDYSDFLLIVNALKTMNKIRTIPKSIQTTLDELELLGEHAGILPDAKECKLAVNDLNQLFYRFNDKIWTIEQVINDPAFPEYEIQIRVQSELKMFAPPHTCANNREFIISELNELLTQIHNELPWRMDLMTKGKIDELLFRASLSQLENKITKFCDQISE